MTEQCPTCGQELLDPIDALSREIWEYLAAHDGRYRSHRELAAGLLSARVRFSILDLDAALDRLSGKGHLMQGPKLPAGPGAANCRTMWGPGHDHHATHPVRGHRRPPLSSVHLS
jgi:hypothetical protein